MRRFYAFLLVISTPACFLTHDGRGDPDDAAGGRDGGGVGDAASADGTATDAGGADGPDPDLGPDARPSDYPEAAGWEPPPRIGGEDPCCVMEEPIVIADDDEGVFRRGGLAVEWGAGRWAVATSGFVAETASTNTTLFELAPDGSLYGTHELELVVSEAFHYAEGRWGFVGFVDDLYSRHALLTRTDFSFVSDPMALGPNHDRFDAAARLTHGNTWVAFRHLDGRLLINPFDDSGVGPEAPSISVPEALVKAEGMRSRIAVLVGTPREASTTNQLVVLGPGPEFAEVGRVRLTTGSDYAGEIDALRDLVVIATSRDSALGTVEIVDPFASSLVSSTDVFPPALDVAGSSKFGVAGLCGTTCGDAAGEMCRGSFALIGMDGEPVGRSVEFAEDAHIRGCAVGTDDRGFLVAWWRSSHLMVRRIFVAE